MLNYTKRNINLLAILLTMFVILIYIILLKSKIFLKSQNYYLPEKNNSISSTKLEERKLRERVQEAIGKKDKQKIELASTYEEVRIKNIETEEKRKIKEMQSNINIYQTNPWRIKIPSLGIDAPITEGTTQEALRRTVGHFEQSEKWNGNVALAAHNRGYRCNFFQEIKRLKNGDIIIYTTERGEKRYQVVINQVVKETDWSYIKQTKDNRITLITCEENKREYRRCIQAIEIKV